MTNDYLQTAYTHKVQNQPQWKNVNRFLGDEPLNYWIKQFNGNTMPNELIAQGAFYGGQGRELGALANKFVPEFQPYDRSGQRIDVIEYHPAYHQLMEYAITHQMHSLPWQTQQCCSHVTRAAMEYLHMQADAGSGCPLTMTFASVAALKHSPIIAEEWLPKILSNQYDERNIPYFQKQGVTIGMAMTEKQGGSDVRANTTYADPIALRGNGEPYRLIGHKWFCSAPMSDAFLVLAQTDNGLSCFLMPRWTPEGDKNTFFIQRLKNKLGNRSNASSEIEFRGAFAWHIGEEGGGIRTIMDMVSLTRFDCMVGSAALMRSSFSYALNFTSQRYVFGKRLVEQPLMQNVLADLALESEAALAFSMRVAHALDKNELPFVRIATALGKYWICKRTPYFIYEAMECLGGMGYIEDNFIPMLYREAPVNAIWEGSGNIQCLDILRIIKKHPESLNVLMGELTAAKHQNTVYDEYLDTLEHVLVDDVSEYHLRVIAEMLAKALTASILIQYGVPSIADTFCHHKLTTKTWSIGTLANEKWYDDMIKRSTLSSEKKE